MTPIDIYKLLPRTNCGECAQKTCMSFALYVKTNPGGVAECKHISADSLEKVRAGLVQSDWRDGLIDELSAEIASLDFAEIARGLGAGLKDGRLAIRCIGVDYVIDNDGKVEPDRGNRWINILLLHYVRSKGKGDFTGKWVSFSEFKGGLVKASSFAREAEEPLRELLDADLAAVSAILERLGGVKVEGIPADCAVSLDLLPKVRALITYRKPDEEFPSAAKIAFDGITGNFLDVESIVFLCEGLVHTVNGMLRHSS